MGYLQCLRRLGKGQSLGYQSIISHTHVNMTKHHVQQIHQFIHGVHPQVKGMKRYMLVASARSQTKDNPIVQRYGKMQVPMKS